MDKNKEIDALYKILALYEDVDKTIDIDNYLSYVDRLYVRWLGIGNAEMYNTLRGLWVLGKTAGHKRVKSMVFYMIGLIERGNENGV